MPKLFKSLLLFLAAVTLSGCSGSGRSEDIAPPVAATGPAATPAAPITQQTQDATPTETSETAGPAPTDSAAAASAPAIPPGPALNLKLSGGIVGFCDELAIDTTGAYRLVRPCAEPPELSGVLAQPDLDSLTAWVQNLASFQLSSADNPGQPDNMTAELVFTGQGNTQADETQQQAIFDWTNSLLVQIRPQAIAPPPTPEPAAIGPEGLCPDIKRPAVVVIDFERPNGMIMIDPDSQANCVFEINQPPYGRIVTAAGNIYYAVYEPEAKTITIWQLSPNGAQTPLPFTSVRMEEFGPFNFTVSADGSKIAWARAVINGTVDPPLYRNDLWAANIDGSNQVTLLDQVEQARSYVEPVRFSADNSTLYYAVQPDGLGGMLFSFSGRYNSLYSLPSGGGEPRLLYVCPEGQFICIGDISPDGAALAYVQPGQGVVILGGAGQTLNTVTPPATDFVGTPIFGPTGNLAFVSATLVQADEQSLPQPDPGYISLVAPPYTGEVKTLLSDNSITATWDWLDENRLVYGAMDEAANIGTALVNLEGQPINLSPNFALAVLR